MKKLLLIMLTSFIFSPCLIAQITRGALEGEIYIITHLYDDPITLVTNLGLIRSVDNGKNIELVYSYDSNPGGFWLTYPVGDAQPGVLYSRNINNTFAKSHNYGKSWEIMPTPGTGGRITSGGQDGEVFKYYNDDDNIFWYSNNYGNNFDSINQFSFSGLMPGPAEGELYGLTQYNQVYIIHSTDYGYTYDSIPLDTNLYNGTIYGISPRLCPGIVPGELYLITLHSDTINPYYFKIYYSSDTAKTFSLKHIRITDFQHYFNFSFTSGRSKGVFYMLSKDTKPEIWPLQSVLYIYYSEDTAETFTEFYHDVSQLPVNLPENQISLNAYSIYPNPASQYFNLILNETGKSYTLTVYNLSGSKIIEKEGFNDDIKIITSGWEKGLYVINLTDNSGNTHSSKIIIN